MSMGPPPLPPEPPSGPPPPPPPSEPAPAPRRAFRDRLGPRALRRAEPRLSIALAAAGCALVVLGVVVVSGDNLGEGDAGGRLPGVVLSAATVVAGYAVLARARTGPLATAGAVASALAVPPLLFFLTFDGDGLPPYSTDAILVVSTAVWAVSWAYGPGRGRLVYLGAALIGLWATVLEVVEGLFSAPLQFLALPFLFFAEAGEISFDDGPSGPIEGFAPDPLLEPVPPFEDDLGSLLDGFQAPDPTMVGVLSLAIGVAYLVAVRRSDRRGLAGVGTAFTVAMAPALVLGVSALSGDLDQAGTGLVAVLVGLAVAAHGALAGRRATTWLGGAGVAIGLAVLADGITSEGTALGVVLVVLGIAVVAGAEAIGRSLREPDEMAPGPSTFTDRAPSGSSPPAP